MKKSHVQAVLRDLSSKTSGAVLDSSDLGYADSRKIDNGRIIHDPFLIAQPNDANDVSAIVKYCVKQDIRFTTKSGGHSANGYALNSEGIVIDLLRLGDVAYAGPKNSTLDVGAGARWIKVYDFLRERQDPGIVVGGGCPGVGVGGFLLGGGYSFLSRSFGLGSDNVKSAEVVLADGTIDTVSAEKNKDLFWGLCGSGGGNFAVTTKFNIQRREVHDPLMVGQIVFPFYRNEEILKIYDKFVQTLPKEMAVYGMMRDFPDPRKRGRPILTLRFTPIFNGPYAKGIELLKPLLDLKPITSEFHAMTLPEWEQFIGSATLVEGRSAYIRSVVLEKGQLHKAYKVFMKHMSRRPSPDSFIVWTHTGGEVAALEDDRSSYAHRSAEVVVEVKSIWDSAMPELTRKNVEWAFDFFEELAPYGRGAYVNYIDPLLPNWQDAYYGAHYNRLLDLKKSWDPDGVFDFLQGIGSNFQPDVKPTLDLTPLRRTF